MVIIVWDYLMLHQIFLSPQMKLRVIISNKHGIFVLLYDLPNNLRIRTLENWEISIKSEKFIEL